MLRPFYLYVKVKQTLVNVVNKTIVNERTSLHKLVKIIKNGVNIIIIKNGVNIEHRCPYK